MDYKALHEKLLSLSTTGGQIYVSKVTPGSKPSLGVRVPDLRKLAKELAKGDYQDFLENGSEEYWEYETLKAFVIGYAKTDIESAIKMCQDFIPKLHDWSVSDSLCQNFTIARAHRERVYAWLMEMAEIDDEYHQRVVAVILMSHLLVPEYIHGILDCMNRLKNPGYYTKMGVAWCVATAYAKFPKETHAFMLDNELDDWTFNKSIQKMIESYRVTDEAKVILRTMKRK